MMTYHYNNNKTHSQNKTIIKLKQTISHTLL